MTKSADEPLAFPEPDPKRLARIQQQLTAIGQEEAREEQLRQRQAVAITNERERRANHKMALKRARKASARKSAKTRARNKNTAAKAERVALERAEGSHIVSLDGKTDWATPLSAKRVVPLGNKRPTGTITFAQKTVKDAKGFDYSDAYYAKKVKVSGVSVVSTTITTNSFTLEAMERRAGYKTIYCSRPNDLWRDNQEIARCFDHSYYQRVNGQPAAIITHPYGVDEHHVAVVNEMFVETGSPLRATMLSVSPYGHNSAGVVFTTWDVVDYTGGAK